MKLKHCRFMFLVAIVLLCLGAVATSLSAETAGSIARLISTELVMTGEFAAPACVKIPAPEQILKTLKTSHPRILAHQADFDRVARLIEGDPFCRQWFDSLREYADDVIGESVSKYEIPDGRRLLATSRRVLGRVTALGMVYRMRPDSKYVDRIWAELEAAGNFRDWNPSHFLDTAEMSLAFAIAYDWLYDQWTPQQRKFIERAIIGKALKVALDVGYGNSYAWFANSHHNWNQVCNGGLLAGALAIAEADPDIAARIITQSAASLPLAMTEYAPDGAWYEGPGYWSYGTSFNVVAVEVLRTALGSDFGLSQIPGFEKAALFPVYMTSPIRRTFNFCDSGSYSVRSASLLWFAGRFDQPVAVDYFKRVMTDNGKLTGKAGRLASLGLFWYDPDIKLADGEKCLNNFMFKGVECASLCEDQYNPSAMYLAFKGGRPNVNHGNIDSGTFIFDCDGVRWAEDLGAENYNIPRYFDGASGGMRWTYYRMRAEGHNTLVVNPAGGEDQDITAISPIIAFEDNSENPSGTVDLTPAYAGFGAESVKRSYELSCGNGDDRYAMITDEIRVGSDSEIWWFMHTPADIKISDDGRSAILQRQGKKLNVSLLSPSGARFSQMPAKALPSSPQPRESNPNEGISKLAIHLTKVTGKIKIQIQLTPQSK